MLNNIETARSYPTASEKANDFSENNFDQIEKTKAGFTVSLKKEKQIKLNNYETDKDFVVNADKQPAEGLKFERNSGSNCCSDISKKCVIF